MNSSRNSSVAPWLAWLADWRLIWPVLLLPVVFLLPALPIDETRYLAVAWEMHNSGNYLVPHLNGAPYSDKPPLLFWLINLSWFVTGLHVWSARLVALAASVLSMLMLQRLALRISGSQRVAINSIWFLLGMVYFAAFSSAIMFDVLLTTCVLLGLHGALDLDAGSRRRGIGLLSLAVGLGIVAKGPVLLLDLGFALALGPYWSPTANVAKLRWYGSVLLALAGGVTLALAWAIPAALVGGDQYAHAIFLHQTVDRMSQSFAHRRPVWWYIAVLPLMVLPWTLAVRAPWSAWRMAINNERAMRFAVAWTVPAFLIFCLISGKQPHYLLPLLPGLALLLALLLEQPSVRLRAGLFGICMVVVGALVVALPLLAKYRMDYPVFAQWFTRFGIADNLLTAAAEISPLWGVVILLLGLSICIKRPWFAQPRALAIACVIATLLTEAAIAQAISRRLDLSPAAGQIAAAQARGQPIAHIGWHHAVYEFAGLLTRPLEKIDYANLHEWSTAHPDGLVMTFYAKYPIVVQPIFEQPFRFGRIAIWRAADLQGVTDKADPRNESGGEEAED